VTTLVQPPLLFLGCRLYDRSITKIGRDKHEYGVGLD
jgi:hypothetical protein